MHDCGLRYLLWKRPPLVWYLAGSLEVEQVGMLPRRHCHPDNTTS